MTEIFRIKFGSHLYGTQTPESDTDYKAIYIPSGRDIVLGNFEKTINVSRSKAVRERNNKDDVDVEIFSLDRYLDLLCEGQTVALDMLFGYAQRPVNDGSPTNEIMDTVYKNRFNFISKNVCAFIGYAKQQAYKYSMKITRMDILEKSITMLESLSKKSRLGEFWESIEFFVACNSQFLSSDKLPLIEIVSMSSPDGKRIIRHLSVCGKKIAETLTVEKAIECYRKAHAEYGDRVKMQQSKGFDFKALSHAFRVISEARELLDTGFITFPRPERDTLIKIKAGELPYAKVSELIESGLEEVLESQKKSTLRETPDRKSADDIVYGVYLKKVFAD